MPVRDWAPARVFLAALLPAWVAAQGLGSVADDRWTRNYDEHFRKYSKHYFGPNVDWRWFKAQAIVESGLKTRSRGTHGGRGVMQIKPTTFAEIKKQNPHFIDIEQPRWNIAAGVYYMRSMFDKWQDRRPVKNRLAFAFGSYNAGHGRMLRAVSRTRDKGKSVHRWDHVAPQAPPVTRHYVRKIFSLMGQPMAGKKAHEARAHTQTSTLDAPARLRAVANSPAV